MTINYTTEIRRISTGIDQAYTEWKNRPFRNQDEGDDEKPDTDKKTKKDDEDEED